MSTQVSTWPKGLYEADRAARAAAGQGRTASRPFAESSALENVPAIALTALLGAEVAAVAAGAGILLASLATLVVENAR